MYVEFVDKKHDLVVDTSEDIEPNTYDLLLKAIYCLTFLGLAYIICDCIKNK